MLRPGRFLKASTYGLWRAAPFCAVSWLRPRYAGMRPPLPLAGEGVMAAEMLRSSGLEWYSVLSVTCQNARLSGAHSRCGPRRVQQGQPLPELLRTD